MNLTRKSLKDGEEKAKGAASFVEAVEQSQRSVGRPKTNREVTKPVSISLTDTDKKQLDTLVKRYNLLAYQNDFDVTLTRSDVIRLMTQHLSQLDDDKYLNMINKLLK